MAEITDEEERFGLYTGDRCPADKRDAIIQLVAEGRAPHEIGRLLRVDRRTVLNVADRFAVEIGDYEQRMPAKLRRCKFAIANRIEREVNSLPAQSLALTLKMISDIEALDSGRASARVEHVHRVDLFADFGQFVQDLETAEVIPEKNGATNPFRTPGNLLMAGDPAADQASAPGFDAQSEVFEAVPQANVDNLPSYHTDSEANGAESDPGTPPGRASREGGVPHGAKGNGSQKFLDNGTLL